MKTFLMTIAVAVLVASSAAADDKVAEFFFSWTITKHEGAKLQITKTAESTTVVISTANANSVSMVPEDAVAVGKVLAKAKTTKIDEGASQDFTAGNLTAGKMVVAYRSGDKGLSASLKKEGSDDKGVVLNGEQVAALVPFLMNAAKFAARVDSKINPKEWQIDQETAPFIFELF